MKLISKYLAFLESADDLTIPVAVKSLSLELGIRELQEVSLEGHLCALDNGSNFPTITISEGLWEGRARFAIAHQLSHYLCGHHSSDNAIHCGKVEFRRLGNVAGNREDEANSLADQILMPQKQFEEFVQSRNLDADLLLAILQKFGSTKHSVIRRLTYSARVPVKIDVCDPCGYSYSIDNHERFQPCSKDSKTSKVRLSSGWTISVHSYHAG